jgi:uncharacterized protein (TIGR02118 family)
MIRVLVCYPAGEGSTFDMEYYKTKHHELVMRSLKGVERFDIEQGLDGPYMAVGTLVFPDMETLQGAMGNPEAAATAEDVKNYTNVTPVMQVLQSVD